MPSVYFDRFHWGRKLRARSPRPRARRPRFGYHRGAMNLPRTADVVIIGGGVVGCSIAYHLARRGARDVLVLERDDGRRGHHEQGGGRHPRAVPHGDGDPLLPRGHPGLRALRGRVRRRPRLPEDRLPVPDLGRRRPARIRVPGGAPAEPRRRRAHHHAARRQGARARAPRRRPHRRRVGPRRRHGRPRRGDERLRAARAGAGRAHRRGRRRGGHRASTAAA